MMDRAQYFKSIEERYGLPGGYLEQTMTIESQGNIRAYNKATKAAGPFQFIPDSQKEFNLKNPYSLEESADAAARMAVRNRTSLQRNGIENPTGADLYAAHQQGARGYVDLLRGGDQLAVKVRGEKPVLLNGGKSDMTASDFVTKIRTKFSGDDTSPLPKTAERTATGVFAKPNVDVAENPDQAAALEGQAPLSTQDVLDTSNAAAGRSGSGLKELGFLHNYFKSLDTSATGVKPLSVPDFFNQPRYNHGGIVSLKKDAKRVRAAGIGGDTVLAHITAKEAALLKSMGGSGRINPRTGLPMFDGYDGNNSDSKSDAPDAPGTNSNTSSGQEQGPGLGLNDSFGAQPGEYGPSMGSMNFGGPTVSDALGDTSLGSFGFNGITSNSFDVTSPFSGQVTAPEAVPGYEGSSRGPSSVTSSVFSDPTPTVESPAPPSVLDTLNDVPSSFKSTPDKPPGFDTALSLASIRDAISKNIDAIVGFPSAWAKGPTEQVAVTPTNVVSTNPSTTAMVNATFTNPTIDLGNNTKSQAFSLSGPNMTAAPAPGTISATGTGSGLASTQSSYGGAFGLGSLGSTPSTAAPESGKVANTESTVSNLVGGFLSGLNSTVNSVTNAVSSMLGKGNTTDSPANNTTDSRSSTDVGPGPSTGDRGDYGGTDGGRDSTDNTVVVPTTTLTTPITPAESSIKYDISKFLGDVGKTTYTTPASVYTSYPVQQGIGSIAAPKYTGSFYNPSFGKIPYQRRYP